MDNFAFTNYQMTSIWLCTLSHAVQYLAQGPGEGHAFIMMEDATIQQPRGAESTSEE